MRETLIKVQLDDTAEPAKIGTVIGAAPTKIISILATDAIPKDAKVIEKPIGTGGVIKINPEEPVDPEAPVESEMVDIEIPDPLALTPITQTDLDALFVKVNPDDPMSPTIEGYGYSLENHDEDGTPIFWTRTSDEVADALVADSRVIVHLKGEGWPIEVEAKDDVINIEPGGFK